MSLNVRTATMSLVVFVEDARLGAWARERAQGLAARHSSSVLVFDAAEGGGERNDDAWREIDVRGSSPDELEQLAAAHLPSELPRVLLWVAPMTASDARFMRLGPEMRGILLDSSRVRDDAAALRDLVLLREREPSMTSIHDLAYLRLAPWQEVVAEFFDGRAFVDDLFDLRSVRVSSGSDAEGYYLLGWLATRLGWEPGEGCTFRPRGSTREIAYAIVREGQARRVKRVALASNATQFVAELCNGDNAAVSLAVTGAKERPPRVEPLHDVDIASLLERAVLQEQPDPVFFDALEYAGKLLACT